MSGEQSMIERVARAMCEAAEEDWDAASYLDTASGNDPEEQRDYWRVMARAAIEAMREPTDAMLTAVDCGGEKREWLSGKMRVSNWQAMIDAALNEHANAR